MATISQAGIPGIGDGYGNGILQPKLKNRWRVNFVNFGSAQSTAPSNNVSWQAVNVSRPVLNFDEVQLDRYNSRAWVAGKHTFDPMTLTLEDDVTGLASAAVREQLAEQQFLTGSEGPWLAAANSASDYKFITKLELLDGNQLVVEDWLIEGCWLQNVNYNDLDYAASEAVQITLNIRYDNASQNINGLRGDDTGGSGIATN